MSNLQTISKRYKIFFQCIFILVAIGVPVFWLTIKTKYDIFSLTGVSQAFDLYIHHSLSLLNRLLSLIISLIPTSVVLYMLVLLIRLFGHYEKQEIFSKKTTMLYGKLGKSLIYWFISQPIYDALISLTLTFQNPVGHRFINISIDRLDILALLTGLIVILIASVMKKAYELSEENKLTI